MLIPAAIAIAATFATFAGAVPGTRDGAHPVVAHGADTLHVVLVVSDTSTRRSLVHGATL